MKQLVCEGPCHPTLGAYDAHAEYRRTTGRPKGPAPIHTPHWFVRRENRPRGVSVSGRVECEVYACGRCGTHRRLGFELPQVHATKGAIVRVNEPLPERRVDA
jgi:hypothetical protein